MTSNSVCFNDRISPHFCQRPVKTPPVRQESLTMNIPRSCVTRGGNLERRHFGPPDIEESEKMDASEIHAKRLNAKKVLTPSGRFFWSGDGTAVKLSGEDQVLRTSSLIRDHPDRGEEQGNLQGESDGSPPPLQDSSPDDGEARNDFWSISGNYTYRHHVEPRVKLYVPRGRIIPNSTTNTLTWPELRVRPWM